MLDYRTNNPRWGLSGISFSDWDGFALTLGLLSNINHHRNRGTGASIWANSISIHIERNNDQGAWDREGRIHYYGTSSDLSTNFSDLFNCRSAGNGNITCRMNSNGYIYSLLQDFNFQLIPRTGYLTGDILPPINAYSTVQTILNNHLVSISLSSNQISSALQQFDIGWNI